ncbi:MAG: chemotaxis protein CheW [Polyangiaceae bacterium]|nr:chemotaxis protein CheW [Polyangiaceae bacterium]
MTRSVDEAPNEVSPEPLGPDELARRSFLVFHVGWTRLAFPARDVEAITDRLPATPLPRAPSHIVGLMGFRGRPLPLVGLSSFLGLATSVSEDRPQRVVVVAVDAMQVGLVCDRVDGVVHVAVTELSPPKISLGGALGRFAKHEIALSEGLVVSLELRDLVAAARPRGAA